MDFPGQFCKRYWDMSSRAGMGRLDNAFSWLEPSGGGIHMRMGLYDIPGVIGGFVHCQSCLKNVILKLESDQDKGWYIQFIYAA